MIARAGASTALYALVGHPLDRTLSPPMQNAAFRHLSMQAVYVPVSVAPGDLERELRALVSDGALGLNVTAPYKAEVIELLDTSSVDAARTRSVNTIAVRDGRLEGSSTDGAGFLADLAAWDVEPAGIHVLLLGGGGAARAAAAALVDSGARVSCVVRRPGRFGTLERVEVRPLADLPALLRAGVDLVVNATPIGGDGVSTPPLPLEAMAEGTRLYDMVPVRGETPLVRAARERGLSARGGLGMLVHQGALAFETWTGERAPIEVMAAAIGARHALA